jgi:hypothetical protein
MKRPNVTFFEERRPQNFASVELVLLAGVAQEYPIGL